MYEIDNTTKEDTEYLRRKRKLSKETNNERDFIKIENSLVYMKTGCEEFKQ